ncbi:MAG: DUF3047 domain-containing protein [Gammaproteobacteria bacterium WSBS_2016_MAG_OTU1]
MSILFYFISSGWRFLQRDSDRLKLVNTDWQPICSVTPLTSVVANGLHTRRYILLFTIFLVSLVAQTASANTITLLANGNTSTWEYKTFDDIPQTNYRTIEDADLGKSVLLADSQHSASGYVRKDSIPLKNSPWLHFQWRVDSAGSGFNRQEKSGDDYAFRLYFVAEDGLVGSRGVALVISEGENGDTYKSPFSTWPHDLQIYQFANDHSSTGEWNVESINLQELWQQLHDTAPPVINLVGLMSDSDSAGEIMQTRYGDVLLSDSALSPF